MSREAAASIMIAVALVAIALIVVGWIRRTRRDAGLDVPLGEPTGEQRFAAFHCGR